MKTDLKEQIIQRIANRKLNAFSCYDFTDLASYKTVNKCLERLEDTGKIKRVMQGIYCHNRFDKTLSLPILPSISDVANCIARKHNWIICPTGNTALNIMGISTQVPAMYNYLSTGPYMQYLIMGVPVSFKRTMSRELIGYSYRTLLLIQCIKAIGWENITDEVIALLKTKMSPAEKQTAIKETSLLPAWIRKAIVNICKE